MATTTQTIEHRTPPPYILTPGEDETAINYPDPTWSHTTINYFKDASQPPPTAQNSTLSTHDLRVAARSEASPNAAPTPVRIRNIRGHEADYSIATQGFTIARLDSAMQHASPRSSDWHDDAKLKQIYFPELTALLRRETGAKYVYQYEWHVRSQTLEASLEQDSEHAVDIAGPVRRVHIDETPAAARREYEYYVRPDDPGNEHLRGRDLAVVNVWKPLKTVRRDPLCLCDQRTVRDEDLQPGKITVLDIGEIENFAVRAPKTGEEGRHEFVYLRGQEPGEVLVFRIFDSRLDGGVHGERGVEGGKRIHGVAHTSFVDPGTEGEGPRESIEVRSFCVF